MAKKKVLQSVEYARWCIDPDNNKVPKYVKKQCQVFLDIFEGKDTDAYFDMKAHDKIVKVMGLMVHPDLQAPMQESLERYQWLIVDTVFCIKNREDNTRYYQTVLLEVARKNFKTFTCAIVMILLMLTEPKFSRFFSVAPDLALSKELQIAIHKIIKSSPLLSREIKPVFKSLRDLVRCEITESEYKPLAYNREKMDGRLANAFLADECGAMDDYPISAMRTSQVTLKNKLGLIISTQYPNTDNGFIDEVDKVKKTLDGILSNRRIFGLLYEPDDYLLVNDQWMTNDLVIYHANPVGTDHPEIFQVIKEMREEAVLYESKKENFLCKLCNIQYAGLGSEGYIDVTKLRECKRARDDSWWYGRDVFLGLDLAATGDNVSVAMVTVDGNTPEEATLYGRTMGFIPKDAIGFKNKREHLDYNKFIKNGECIACGDMIIDYSVVENYILTLEETLGVNIVQLGYDKWNALSTVQKLEAGFIDCVEIRQHSSVLHPATKWLQEKIMSKKFVYDENEMLEINFQNARCTYDTNNNMYVSKKASAGTGKALTQAGKVDQVVGLINASLLALTNLQIGGCGIIVC